MTRRCIAFLAPLLIAISLLSPGSRAQGVYRPFQRIAYQVSMPTPASHLFFISIIVETPSGELTSWIDFQMPRWQPGRYSLGDFAKNVQEFSAQGGSQVLPFEKIDDQTWRVQTRGSRSLSVSYKVFGNDLSGTYAQLDTTHANFNGGEIFMYVVGHKQDAVELRIEPPRNWRVINGSTERPVQTEWKYPNYETLIDNPTEVGPRWTLDDFSVGGKTYHVVVHSRGPEESLRPQLVRGLEAIVRAEVGMWGPPDFNQYTFIIHYAADDESGDGMEHLTSTQIVLSGALGDPGAYESTLETAAHEFFHVWNVKRLRPVEFGPWDWTRPVSTKSLWLAEGFTEYYGNLMLRRAGLWDDGRFLRQISSVISNAENNPGATLMSAVDASLAAPFIDSGLHHQHTNLENTSFIYYYSGELIGLVLDLTIRARSNGTRSLDDVMKRMYDEFYVKSPNATYYLKGRGYTNEDFVRVLSEVAGMDLTEFYDKHIRGVEPLPYAAAFAPFGLTLVKTPAPGQYTAGMVLDSTDRQDIRLGALRNGSPAERAGLQQGDVVLSIGGEAVNRGNWRTILNRHTPGSRIQIQVRRFRQILNIGLEMGQTDVFNYRLEEVPNASPQASALRAAWLTGKTN